MALNVEIPENYVHPTYWGDKQREPYSKRGVADVVGHFVDAGTPIEAIDPRVVLSQQARLERGDPRLQSRV